MIFVDGENIAIRGSSLAESRGIKLEKCEYYEPDVFLWNKGRSHATQSLTSDLRHLRLRPIAERAYLYTSMSGDDDAIGRVLDNLWDRGFSAEVFKKTNKQQKAKGVDIALTKDLLSNAFLDNYDVAVVLSGDADYLPVIQEVRRLGKLVCVMAIVGGGAKIQPSFRRGADFFIPLDDIIMKFWPVLSSIDEGKMLAEV